jgi:hypothetical protein
MPRCPDCNKFVSLDAEVDPEINVTVDDEGVITGDVRIANACGECGTELLESTFSVEVDLSAEIRDHRDEHEKEKSEHNTLDVDDDGGSRVDEFKGPGRRAAHLYGAEVEFTVTCKCGEKFSQSWRETVQSSSMDSLV